MPKVRACPYCGHEMRAGTRRAPTVDHVVPRACGGLLDNGNKLVVCGVCNGDKGSLCPDDWHEILVLAHDPRAEKVARVATARRRVTEAWPSGGGNLAMALANLP